MKTEILTLLRESKEYISGQELCTKLGVSRTAVWKVMKQLKEEGYEIEAIQNKGYRLTGLPEVLSESELSSRIHTKWAGKNLHYFKETGSTNTDAKRFAEAGESHGTLVVADMQSAGRGRRGRSWQAPFETTISMTIILKPDFAPNRAPMLTLVMALSVAKAMVEITNLDCKIKWPNDIVVNGKKVCGILTEMNAEMDYIHYVVIGVGINVNLEKFPEDIAETATSLLLESGHPVSRAQLIQKSMEYFEQDYETFVRDQNFSGLMQEYGTYLVNKGTPVKVLDPKGEFTGTARGINEQGELLVELEDGSITAIYAGEVSVRGIYGYV